MLFQPNTISRDQGFMVQLCYRIFFLAERVSIFYWLRKLSKIVWTRCNESRILNPELCAKLQTPFVLSYAFVEAWTLGNMLLSVLLSQVLRSGWSIPVFAVWCICVYAILRIFEMFVYQFNVLFFHRLNGDYAVQNLTHADELWSILMKAHPVFPVGQYAIKSATRTVLSLIINMVEYIFFFDVLFACATILNGGVYADANTVNSFLLFMSLDDMTSLSSANHLIICIAKIEIFFGIFINLICLGRFIGLLPEVKQMNNK